MLWNVFYHDARYAINGCGFTEIAFVDDPNSFKENGSNVSAETIAEEIKGCQNSLHRWGRANQVTFDPAKESSHVISRTQPHGNPFKLLGITFDCKLVTSDTVFTLAKSCRWKLAAILRTIRCNTIAQSVLLYKAQLLSYIEYRTPAVYHACASSLDKLEDIQNTFLQAVRFCPVVALTEFRLAPLSTRRDIAMMGLIHRTVLGLGPSHFQSFFKPDFKARAEAIDRHRLQIVEYSDGHWSRGRDLRIISGFRHSAWRRCTI